MKQFGTPPFLSTNPSVSEQFFVTPFFVQVSKTRTPLILGESGEYGLLMSASKDMTGWGNVFIGKCVSAIMHHMLRTSMNISHRKL